VLPTITANVIRFIPSPTFIISTVLRFEASNTIALGAVETGSMKAQEAVRVAGNIRNRGFIL